VKLVEARDQQDLVLRLDLGAKAQAPGIDGTGADRLKLAAPAVPGGLYRLHGPEGRWLATFRTARLMPAVDSAGEFLVSQFKTALGDRAALAKTDLEQDPMLSGLLELFRYADRNGDDRLSLAELEDYLKLIELGMHAQVWIRVTDPGRNPFQLLDADGDGRLSYQELVRAADLLPGSATEADMLPAQFQLSFGGPAAASWGGVPVPALAKKKPRAETADAAKVPHWFQALDRNGDGVVSPREFLGPPEAFRNLDLDGDGVISSEEATRAADH
jgi:Ca2+-binding EF-hand superfamily protein